MHFTLWYMFVKGKEQNCSLHLAAATEVGCIWDLYLFCTDGGCTFVIKFGTELKNSLAVLRIPLSLIPMFSLPIILANSLSCFHETFKFKRKWLRLRILTAKNLHFETFSLSFNYESQNLIQIDLNFFWFNSLLFLM